MSPIKDINLKARFSEPPAPPPQQPLPEKPDAHSSLRRSDTERPKINGSPVRSDTQMSSLNEALQNAKKEMESQSIRLRNLETLLNEERRAREDAEERANRLERERAVEEQEAPDEAHKSEAVHDAEDSETETIVANGPMSSIKADTAAARLQQKLDIMMSEMSELRIQMETYRERAESAEADRKSLAEMIENIRQDNAKKSNKRRSRGDSDPVEEAVPMSDAQDNDTEESEEGEILIINEDVEDDNTQTLIRRAVQNGRQVQQETEKPVAKTPGVLTTRANRNEIALAHGAPAVSILTVVALGVAVMAWLNNYPKVDR